MNQIRVFKYGVGLTKRNNLDYCLNSKIIWSFVPGGGVHWPGGGVLRSVGDETLRHKKMNCLIFYVGVYRSKNLFLNQIKVLNLVWVYRRLV